MKLTDDFKFRYVDTELTKEEIEELSKNEWRRLYLYMVERDKPFKKGIFSAIREMIQNERRR